MAKKIYHIPIEKSREFIKANKTKLNSILKNPKEFEYKRYFGKVYYELEIEKFLQFFQIEKDKSYALQAINYFHSKTFLETLYGILNLEQFNTQNQRELLYLLLYHFYQNNFPLFNNFLQKTFLHFFTQTSKNSNIKIDYKDICHTLINQQNRVIKESFKEENTKAIFRIYIDEELKIEIFGNSIKTLRKRAYKRLFELAIDQ